MKIVIRHLAIYISMWGLSVFLLTSFAVSRPYNISDGIERTRLYDTSSGGNDSIPFKISSNAEFIFFITGRGDLQEGMHHFELRYVRTKEISALFNKKYPNAPMIHTIASVKYKQDEAVFGRFGNGGIKNVIFDDFEQKIYFLSPDERSIFQVFSSDLKTKKLTKLTNAPRHISDYVVLRNSDALLYAVIDEIKDEDCSKVYFRVDVREFPKSVCLRNGKSLFYSYFTTDPLIFDVSVYKSSINSVDNPVRLATGVRLLETLEKALQSYDGSRLIVKLSDKKIGEYTRKGGSEQFYEDPWFRDSMEVFDENFMRPWLETSSIGVFDLEENGVEIVDGTSKKGKNIIEKFGSVSNKGGAFRRGSGATTVVPQNIKNVAVAKKNKANKKHYGGDSAQGMRSVESSEVISNNDSAVIEADCPRTKYGWDRSIHKNEYCSLTIRHLNLRIYTGERYDTPANIYAMDVTTGRSMLVFELNPQFRSIDFGRVELLRWTDTSGVTWQAGLVFPTSFKEGQKYPIVVQTHGFDPNSFLIDGPFYATAPYAAQALAANGIMVLQMPDPVALHSTEVNQIAARGIVSAIDLLVRRGIVDEEKVGMLGYSASGSLVLNMLIFRDFLPAAALIADAYSGSPFGYATLFGTEAPGMLTAELFACGARPWGAQQDEWIRRSPFYHLDSLETPLLLKEYTPLITSWWDIYTGLKRLHKPIDFYIYTAGGHPTLDVATIRASQQLTVDWFKYWLKNEKNHDPKEAEQYRAWDKIRAGLSKSQPDSKALSAISKMDCTNLDELPKI